MYPNFYEDPAPAGIIDPDFDDFDGEDYERLIREVAAAAKDEEE